MDRKKALNHTKKLPNQREKVKTSVHVFNSSTELLLPILSLENSRALSQTSILLVRHLVSARGPVCKTPFVCCFFLLSFSSFTGADVFGRKRADES